MKTTIIIVLFSLFLSSLSCDKLFASSLQQTSKNKNVALTFQPPYSDQSYSCRCLARSTCFEYHRTVCEYKSYIGALNQPVHYIFNLLDVDQTGIVNWFRGQCTFLKKKLKSMLESIIRNDEKSLSGEDKESLDNLCTLLQQDIDDEELKGKHLNLSELERILSSSSIPRKKSNKLISLFEQAQWFFSSSKSINCREVKKHLIPLLNIDLLLQKITTPYLKTALKHLCNNYDSSLLFKAWEVLRQYDPEEDPERSNMLLRIMMLDEQHNSHATEYHNKSEKMMTAIFIALKEFTSIIAVFNHSLCKATYQSLNITEDDDLLHMKNVMMICSALNDAMTVYNIVKAMPITETILAINKLTDSFYLTLDRLKSHSDHSTSNWFKNMWVKVPVAIGVVIIKTFEYYCGMKEEEPHDEENESVHAHEKPIIPPLAPSSFGTMPHIHSSSITMPTISSLHTLSGNVQKKCQ